MSCARLCLRGGVQLLCLRSLSSCSASPAGDRPDGSISCAWYSPQAVLWMVHMAAQCSWWASPAGTSGFSESLQCCCVWVPLKALLSWECWMKKVRHLSNSGTQWLWIFLTRNLCFFSLTHDCNCFLCYLLYFCLLHVWMHAVSQSLSHISILCREEPSETMA